MFIDIGGDKEEAQKWGVQPGNMIVPYSPYRRLNDTKFLLAKAWDNRIGVAVALKVLENLSKEERANSLYAVEMFKKKSAFAELKQLPTASILTSPLP